VSDEFIDRVQRDLREKVITRIKGIADKVFCEEHKRHPTPRIIEDGGMIRGEFDCCCKSARDKLDAVAQAERDSTN